DSRGDERDRSHPAGGEETGRRGEASCARREVPGQAGGGSRLREARSEEIRPAAGLRKDRLGAENQGPHRRRPQGFPAQNRPPAEVDETPLNTLISRIQSREVERCRGPGSGEGVALSFGNSAPMNERRPLR